MLSDGSPHSSRVHYARGILCDFLFPAHATTSVFVASGALGRDHRRAGSIRPSAGHSGPHPIPRASSTASSSSQRGLTEAVPDAQFSVMPPPKRGGSELNNGTPAKFPKTTENPEEFSSAVKKRLQSSNRTGQACDRCKVRKIRCDGLPGGCSPCLQNSTECATTDRITGRAMSRGYVEGLEQQNAEYQQRIQELEQRLMQNGVESKSSNGYQGTPTQKYDYANLQSTQNGQIWNPSQSSFTPSDASTALTSQQEETKALPAFRAGCAGDNYLGVSGNSHLSSIKGTALSILGMEIDIADFESPDMDEPDPSVFHPRLYNKSYQAFLQSALNVNPRLENVELPPKQEGLTYASWYFRVISAYMPILHRPTFMKVLNRIYDDPSFRPTTAETVMVHMIFAIMYFQQGTRNWEDNEQRTRFNTLSNMHYHYCLSMFSSLMSNHTFQDVQALTLICAHLRNFPKPGASWLMTQTTMSLAIEMGLHRSVKRWASESIPNPLEVEMRKRTFWSLLAIDVTLSGKLGRPMRFTHDDFDVEFPDPVDDELLSEAGLDTSRGPGKCLHKIGLSAYKLLPLFMELYSTIYAVRRRPETYISQVNRLESLLRDWKESLPTELVKGQAGPGEQEGRVFALYTQVWALEFRLLLRHPAVSLTSDTTFNAASMRICVESARQMLAVVRQLQKFKSLDTTWYNSTVYVMAITTTLFDQWDRRGEISGADLAALKDEMDMWLDVMGDVGALLGSGTRLREAVKVVTDGTLSLLSRSLPPKKASYLTKANLSQEDIKPEPDIDTALQSASNAGNEFSNNYSYTNTDPQSHGSGTTSTYLTSDNHLPQGHQSAPYPTSTQYPSYTESSATTLNTYINYQTSSTDSVDAPLQLDNYSSQTSQVPYPYTTPSRPQSSPMNSGSQAWQQWTSTVAGNIEHQGYSNTMMMQMTGRPGSVPQNQVNASMVDLGSTQAAVGIDVHSTNMGVGQLSNQVAGGISWPLNIFDVGATQQGP